MKKSVVSLCLAVALGACAAYVPALHADDNKRDRKRDESTSSLGRGHFSSSMT